MPALSAGGSPNRPVHETYIALRRHSRAKNVRLRRYFWRGCTFSARNTPRARNMPARETRQPAKHASGAKQRNKI
jgi:hypothetical protein